MMTEIPKQTPFAMRHSRRSLRPSSVHFHSDIETKDLVRQLAEDLNVPFGLATHELVREALHARGLIEEL
jgi:hypothetical protein